MVMFEEITDMMHRIFLISGCILAVFVTSFMCALISQIRVADRDYVSYVDAFYKGVRAAEPSWLEVFVSIHGEGVNSVLKKIENHIPSPFYALTQMGDDTTDDARAVISLVFSTFEFANNDGSYMYHPLTNAYRSELYNLARRFLTPEPTDRPRRVIREVYASMLECHQIEHVDRDVTLVVDVHDRRTCIVRHGRARQYATSHLRTLYMDQHNNKNQGSPPSRNATNPYSGRGHTSAGTTDYREPPENRKRHWHNPFVTPLPGPLPPRNSVIMNPADFEDFTHVLWYYCFGVPLNSAWAIFITLLVVFFLTLIQCVWFCSVLRYCTRAQRGQASPQPRERVFAGQQP